ncbi:hypothetical protein [Stutzerimonas stutzeri]|uniref:hypothetical protein n=1 Tax=Stutzerimonas stutzeri TaxID=316 RepID=UPI000F7818A8|nr:hypothetical protein [Stutzerimonas stutzeri]MCP3430657.1 hypothetical protein [Stutzerimonas stutzeri]RTM17051.1 hypothetical protein EKN22_17640 [Stutzerimonas stutzeri]
MLTRHQKLRLVDALLERYPDEMITGYVMNARIVSACLVGRVYQAWGYAQGERLVSGAITQIIRYERRWLVKTSERDSLLIVNFAPGGRRSLLHLAGLFETAQLTHSRWCLH